VIYIYPLPLGPSSHSLISPIYVITEQQAELPVIYSSFPLAICSTHGSVYTSLLISEFVKPSPSPPPHPHVCSLCLCLHSCPANRFTCTIFLNSTHMYYYTIFVFLTSLCMTDSRSIHIPTNDPTSFLFMANNPLHIYTMFSLSIHLLMDI